MDHADAVPIAELLDERRYLLDVASWMLGSPGGAESVVDETYRRWYGLSDAARGRITAPRSWLARIAGGICVGLLSPTEGAAPMLDDILGMPPDAVVGIVRRSAPECAELTDRAHRSLQLRRSRPTAPTEQDALARAVHQACVSEDADVLASLLCPDATAFFDGGGKVRALSRPVHGNRQVARSLLTLLARPPRTTLTTHAVNGTTGLVARYHGRVAAVISLDIADRQVAQVWVVLNPDKLRSWNRQSDG